MYHILLIYVATPSIVRQIIGPFAKCPGGEQYGKCPVNLRNARAKKKLLKSGQYEDWPVKLTASVTLDILKIVRVFSKMPDFNSGQY